MKIINFEQPTEITSEKVLQQLTGIRELYFDSNTVINFLGKISLSSGIHFRGRCKVGSGVSIDTGCILNEVNIGKDCEVRAYSILNNCSFGNDNIIGPHCFIRDGVSVGNSCIVGSFVEVARSELGHEIKISHQAFIGDALIEDRAIIGAGVVFCNYDGSGKQLSSVGNGTSIGSGTMIVSPVKIGSEVIVGAGSVVTKDIQDKEIFIQSRSK